MIVPTFNRRDYLADTLASLTNQTLASDHFEVIVVDDGSSDGTEEVARETYPFRLRYIRQDNQGDAEARNTGALHSEAKILVFLDDDILVEPEYLESVVQAQSSDPKRIIVGKEIIWTASGNPLRNVPERSAISKRSSEIEEIDFTEVCSNNMSVCREAYFSIGMMQGLDFPGSSIWCDVDFSYRAYLQGHVFFRSDGAICWHRDYVSASLESQKMRMREASFRAVSLFQKYPDLSRYLPMFTDKLPIDWQSDPARLIVRKLMRQAASSRLALQALEWFAQGLEKADRSPDLQESLQRWIIGGYVFRGYREGLKSHFRSNGDT